MKLPNIALHYNAEIRNNGTPRRVWDTYVRMGGKEVGGKRYSRPAEDIVDHDFHLFIDDGRDKIPMDIPGPSACWLVDTHLGWDIRKEWAEKFDYVFCAQKPGAERMAAEGLNAHWLPLACYPSVDPCATEFLMDPEVESLTAPWGLDKRHDTAFVGFFQKLQHESQNDRLSFLDRMFMEFPNSWIANNCFFEEAALRYIRAKVGLNISILDDLNMRFFEVMSYGTCLLTNRDVVGWEELGFEEGVHFLGYSDVEEAIKQVRWALENPTKRERIARTGHRRVREQHTYTHRVEQIIEVINA
jgi:glycosyltransferase involved in cell wall biosynthesis